MDISIRGLLENRKAVIIIVGVLCLLLLSCVSFMVFPEVRDSGAPVLRVEGIQENDRVSNAYTITIFAEDRDTALSSAEVFLNDVLIFSTGIQNAHFTGTTEVSLAGLAEGEHTLAVAVYDRALFKHKSESVIHFWVDRTPPSVESRLNSDTVIQGNTLAVYFKSNEPIANAQVIFKNRQYPVDLLDENMLVYGVFIPVPVLNALQKEPVICRFSDTAGNSAEENFQVSVNAGIFEKEWIEVPQGKVAIFAPSNNDRRLAEGKIIAEAYAVHNPLKYWSETFIHPAEGKMSSAFATQRVYSTGIVASYHKGIDIASRESPYIFAANYGKVIVAGEFIVYGNMVIIDHGHGILTTYGHMSKLLVSEGDFVSKRQVLGVMGDTGLATGPHLHWEMRINGREVNPEQWVQNSFEHPWKGLF